MNNKDRQFLSLNDLLNKNFYQLLEVKPSASITEIRKAYQKMRSIYQPDSLAAYSLFTSEDLEGVIKRLEEVFSVLTDLDKRKKYDASLIEKRQLSEKEVINYKEFKKEMREAAMATIPEQIDDTFAQEPGLVYDGQFLKKVRQFKKISLDEISKITKISPNILTAMEDMNISLLPARIYLKGFLIEYAKCLRLNPKEVVSSYVEIYDKIKASEKK